MSVVPQNHGVGLLAELERLGVIIDKGIILPPGLPYDQYESLCVMMWQVHEVTRFAIGDLIAYGEDNYDSDIYLQAVAMTGLSKNTLENYASASRLVPPQRRRPKVSHSIHVEVKSLPASDQKRILLQAEREDLTKEAVRGLVREAKGKPADPIEREICGECGRPL